MFLFLCWQILLKLGIFETISTLYIGIIKASIFSVPTPSITQSIPTAWAPFSQSKLRLFRIGAKLAVDLDYRADVSRFWNEESPAILQSSSKLKTILAPDVNGRFSKEEL